MTASNFDGALARVLKHEGGWSDHPADPGGATNHGVTIGTLSAHLGRPATKAEVRALTPATVAPIYRARYWQAIHADELPSGVDFCTFDFAVNSGPARAVASLQRAVGVADDGHIGPVTLAAVARADPAQTVERVCDDRLAFLRRLSTWPTFGKGWQRRVEEVEVQSLDLVHAAMRPAGTGRTAPPEIAPAPAVTRPPPTARQIPVDRIKLAAAPAASPVPSVTIMTPASPPAPPGFWGRVADRLRTGYPPKPGV